MKHENRWAERVRKALVVALFCLGIATILASGDSSPSGEPCIAGDPLFRWASPHPGITHDGGQWQYPSNYEHRIVVDPEEGLQFLGRLLLFQNGHSEEWWVVQHDGATVRAFAYEATESFDSYTYNSSPPTPEDSDPANEVAAGWSREHHLYDTDLVGDWVVALWFDPVAATHDLPFQNWAHKDWSVFDYQSDAFFEQDPDLEPLCTGKASLNLLVVGSDDPPPPPPPPSGENRIVCEHYELTTEETNIVKLDPDGVEPPVDITVNDGQDERYPVWAPPDGDRIAFLRWFVLSWTDATGGDLQTIATFSSDDIHWDLAFSPTGNHIALGRWGQGLRLVNVATGAESTLTSDGYDAHPTWSPEGTEIIFVRSADLWRVGAESFALSQLTDTPEIEERSPHWGPDGLLFTAQDPVTGDDRIFLMDPAAPESRTQLTDAAAGTAYDDYPVWSPDGMRIAYVGATGGEEELLQDRIWVMNADGSNPNEVPGQSGGTNTAPDWR